MGKDWRRRGRRKERRDHLEDRATSGLHLKQEGRHAAALRAQRLSQQRYRERVMLLARSWFQRLTLALIYIIDLAALELMKRLTVGAIDSIGPVNYDIVFLLLLSLFSMLA